MIPFRFPESIAEIYCKICNGKIYQDPVLFLKNIPKSSEYFPNYDDLYNDKGINLRIYQCSICGLVQLLSGPPYYYKNVMRSPVEISEEMIYFKERQFIDFIGKYNLDNKKMIEIGAGRGEYLNILQSRNVIAYGMEQSKRSFHECKNAGLNIIKGFLDHKFVIIENSPFDAFCLFNYLDHVPYPVSFLQGISNNLNDDAVGMIEVPNFNHILENKLFSHFIPEHISYFTKSNLIYTLKSAGFNVLECKEIFNNTTLYAEIKKINRVPLSIFDNHINKIKQQLYNTISVNKKTAIWGTNIKSLTILSQMELKNKIACVIDDSPNKQNKYTPSSHIPIVHPDILLPDNEEKINSIIIIDDNPNNILNILKNKYNHIKNISIINDNELIKIEM